MSGTANNMAHSTYLGGALAGLHRRIGRHSPIRRRPGIRARAEAIAA